MQAAALAADNMLRSYGVDERQIVSEKDLKARVQKAVQVSLS
jgi:hypothetical protein